MHSLCIQFSFRVLYAIDFDLVTIDNKCYSSFWLHHIPGYTLWEHLSEAHCQCLMCRTLMPLLAMTEKGVKSDPGEQLNRCLMPRQAREIVLVSWHLACPQSFRAHAEGTRYLGDNNVTLCKNANAATSVTMVWRFTSYTFILVPELNPLLHNTPVGFFF